MELEVLKWLEYQLFFDFSFPFYGFFFSDSQQIRKLRKFLCSGK